MDPILQAQIEEAAFEAIQRKHRDGGLYDCWQYTPIAEPATDGWPGFVSRNPDLARVVLAGLLFKDFVEMSPESIDEDLAATLRQILHEQPVLPPPANGAALTRPMSKAELHDIACEADPTLESHPTRFWRKHILANRIPGLQLSKHRWQFDREALVAELKRLAESDRL